MTSQKTLACRLYYPNEKILYGSLILLFAIYLGEIVFYALQHTNVVRDNFFTAWLFYGLIGPLTIPFIISMIRSIFIINAEGVMEHRGYFWGLFKTEIFTVWSGFQSWDKSITLLPMERKAIPQINLFYAHCKRSIRFNERVPELKCNEKKIKWDTFSAHLMDIFKSVDLPCATPRPERRKRLAFYGFIGITGCIAFIGLLTIGVLTLMKGKINGSAVLVIICFFSIIGAVIFRRPKL